jgi:chemotaxis signal transduction protein
MRRDTEAARRLIEAIHAAHAPEEAEATARALLVFEIAGAELAVDVSAVEAVTRATFIAPVPYGPPSVLGVASVRGRMRLVVDAGGERASAAVYLVLLHGDGQLALAVDRVIGVRRVDAGGAETIRVIDPETVVES